MMSTDESPITEAAKKSRQFFNPRRDISTLIFSIGVIAIIAQLFIGWDEFKTSWRWAGVNSHKEWLKAMYDDASEQYGYYEGSLETEERQEWIGERVERRKTFSGGYPRFRENKDRSPLLFGWQIVIGFQVGGLIFIVHHSNRIKRLETNDSEAELWAHRINQRISQLETMWVDESTTEVH
ncbi:MAG: hypothetical protein HOB29_17650 [Planctomycetaceae bacterium]|nr:hypothetical protein [Planctomycetaceae bacterium]MBT5883468.1 hypothetical protein [Planctomycetaceae bacterium]